MATFKGLETAPQTEGEVMRIAEKDYYADAEGNLVEGDDPKSAIMVAGKGTEISKEIMDKYGISEEAPAEESAPESADEKAAAPAANKAAKPVANKGAKE